jgi:hypothetical protein
MSNQQSNSFCPLLSTPDNLFMCRDDCAWSHSVIRPDGGVMVYCSLNSIAVNLDELTRDITHKD